MVWFDSCTHTYSFKVVLCLSLVAKRNCVWGCGCAHFTFFSSLMYDCAHWLKSLVFYCSKWFNDKCVTVSEKWHKCKYVLFWLSVLLYNPFLCFWFKSLNHTFTCVRMKFSLWKIFWKWNVIIAVNFPIHNRHLIYRHLIYCLHWVLWPVHSLLYFSWINSVMMKWLLPNDSKEES